MYRSWLHTKPSQDVFVVFCGLLLDKPIKHIEAYYTRWPPFCRRRFQIDSGEDLASKNRQDFTHINADQVYQRLMTSLGHMQGVQFSLISTHCALLTPYGGMGFSQSGSSIYLLTDDSFRQLPSPKLTYRESGMRDYIPIKFSWIYLSSCETVVIILFRYNPSSEPTSLYRILAFRWNLHYSQSPSPPPLWKFSIRITELHKSNYGSP